MSDFESRRVIEALRSGVPSRSVGQYFTGTRTRLISQLDQQLDNITDNHSSGMIFTGRYGEGKTHLLNTVFQHAQSRNMVVSFLSLSKESPFDKPHVIYPKIIASTYLPDRVQPGFMHLLEEHSEDSAFMSDLILFAAGNLACNKLSALLKLYVKTTNEADRYKLISDLSGNFMSNADLKKLYRQECKEVLKFNENFAKTKHCADYYKLMSYLFRRLGYNGWVILFDESELIGRLGKKTRLNAYKQMDFFLNPPAGLQGVFSLFAFTASYADDVIEGKHDFENAEILSPEEEKTVHAVLNAIIKASQLQPLSKEEIRSVIHTIIDLYSDAYDWIPDMDFEQLFHKAENSGVLLRTKIRTIIEVLDQLYQYGKSGDIVIGSLASESYEEEPEELTEN